MTRIVFDPDFPEALIDGVESLLTPFLGIVSSDLRTLQVQMKTTGDIEGEAAIIVKRRYHTALLYLDSSFFSLTLEEKEVFLLHELLHVVVDIFSREVRHLTLQFVPEDLQAYVLEAVLEEAEETVVDRLAYVFHEGWKAPQAPKEPTHEV